MNDIVTPDHDWRESVSGIINMGFYLKRMKASLSRFDVSKIARTDFGVDDCSVDRIIKIADHPILSDPENADRLPVGWGLLHELRFLPDDILLEKLKKNELIHVKKYDIWEWRGVKMKALERRGPNGRKGGSKVHAPAGTFLLQYIRIGMAMEAAEKLTAEEVAERLDIFAQTYRMIRTMIQLSERPELADHDREFVNGLLEKVEKTRNVRSYYREAKPLIERVWGTTSTAQKNDKGMQKRVDDFRTKVIILHDTCQRIMDQEVPYMSDEDVNSSINELVNSGKIIRKLAEKLRRSKDG